MSALYQVDSCYTKVNCRFQDTILDQRSILRRKITTSKTRIIAAKNQYDAEITKFKETGALKEAKEVREEDAKIEKFYNTLFNSLDSILLQTNSKNTKKIITSLAGVINNTDFKYTSFPIQRGFGDQSFLTIKVEPRDSNSPQNTYNRTYFFPSYKKYFIGTGSAFYIANLFDENYSTIAFDTIIGGTLDTLYQSINEDFSKYETGLSLTMNIGFYLGKKNKKHGRKTAVGLYFGTGISYTKKIRPRLLYGLNFSFGKRNKITFGAGGITGYVNRLSNVVKENLISTLKPESVVISKLNTKFSANIGYIYAF